MAGHNKWSQIKRKKGANDKKRSATISKHVRAITSAVKNGSSPDPSGNLALKNAIAAAKADAVPIDNIEAAIKRAAGNTSGEDFKEVTYEGYGINGTAIFIEALTDNINRTVSDIRAIFNKRGGSLGTPGSVAWQFEKKGLIILEKDSEKAQEIAIENEAEDILSSLTGKGLEIISDPSKVFTIQEALENAGFKAIASITRIPSNTVSLNQEETEKLFRIVDALEDLDDIQNVYTNAEPPEDFEI